MATITTASGRVTERAKPAKRQTVKRAKPQKRAIPKSEIRNPKSPEASPAELLIPVAEIVPSPYQPRSEFDSAEIAELAETIRKHGLLQPVVVRLVDGVPELVAGERRLRAVKLLAWPSIRANVRELDDVAACEICITENFDRQDLSPFDEAQGFANWLDLTSDTQAACAERFGITQGQISNRLRLLKLESPWRKLIARGRVTIKQARLLATYAEIPRLQEAAYEDLHRNYGFSDDDPDPLDELDFEWVVENGLRAVTRPLGGGKTYDRPSGKMMPAFKPKKADREAMGIVKYTPVIGRDKPQEFATNVELWEQLQEEYAAKWREKQLVKQTGQATATPASGLQPPADEKAKQQAEAAKRKRADEVLQKRAEDWRTDWLRRLIAARLQEDAWRSQLARRLTLHLLCAMSFDRERAHLAHLAAKALKDRGGKVRGRGPYPGFDLIGAVCGAAIDDGDIEEVLLDVLLETLIDSEHQEPCLALSAEVIERLAEFCGFDLAKQWELLWRDWSSRHREGEHLGQLFEAMNKEQLLVYAAAAKIPKDQLKGKKGDLIEAIRKRKAASPGTMTPPLPTQVKLVGK